MRGFCEVVLGNEHKVQRPHFISYFIITSDVPTPCPNQQGTSSLYSSKPPRFQLALPMNSQGILLPVRITRAKGHEGKLTGGTATSVRI